MKAISPSLVSFFCFCSYKLVVSTFDCLFLFVDFVNPLWVVHFIINLLFSSLFRVQSSKIGRAPHLISIKLIRASVLVTVFMSVHTIKKSVFGLETQLTIEFVGMEITNKVEAVVTHVHYYFYIIIILSLYYFNNI